MWWEIDYDTFTEIKNKTINENLILNCVSRVTWSYLSKHDKISNRLITKTICVKFWKEKISLMIILYNYSREKLI